MASKSKTRRRTPPIKLSQRTNKSAADSDMPEPKPKPKRRWTVLVYLAGDNNLTEECAFAISEMRAVTLSDKIHLLVQFDPKASRLPTQRFEIVNEQGENLTKNFPVHSGPTVGTPYKLGETDTGSARTLYDFISFGIQMYPAHSYLVVLSGHGAGIEENFLLRDENPSGSLSLPEMKEAFKCIKEDFGVQVDIVGLDSCLMSMAEVAFQLFENAHLVVGSEGYAPLGGWPFRDIVALVSQKADDTEFDPTKPVETILKKEREDLAEAIVCTYSHYYMDFVSGGIDVEQSAVDVSKSGELANLVEQLGAVLTTRLSSQPFINALLLAHWDSQSYNGEIYVDLRDFCDCLVERIGSSYDDVKRVCQNISRFIGNRTDPCGQSTSNASRGYVLNSCYTGPSFQYSYGVSIYFPWYEVVPYYEDLGFAQATRWHLFLNEYIKKTRREPRNNGERQTDRVFGDNLSTLPLRNSSGKNSSGKIDRPLIRSMRNAPITLIGLSKCFEGDHKLLKRLQDLIVS